MGSNAEQIAARIRRERRRHDAIRAELVEQLEAERAALVARLTDADPDPDAPLDSAEAAALVAALRAWAADVDLRLSQAMIEKMRQARGWSAADVMALYRANETNRAALERIAYELSLYVAGPPEEDEGGPLLPLLALLPFFVQTAELELVQYRRAGLSRARARRAVLGPTESVWSRIRAAFHQRIDAALGEASAATADRATSEGAAILPGGGGRPPGAAPDATLPAVPRPDATGQPPPGDPPPAAVADPIVRRIIEIEDHRTHPISYVLQDQRRPPGEPFRASVADVLAMSRRLGLPRIPPVYWPRVGGEFVGLRLPAHPYERGVIVPWRASWRA